MRKVILRGSLILAVFGIWILFMECGGSGGGSNTTVSSAENVQPIVVNGGTTADSSSGNTYPNDAFTSVTVCVPGTSNCQMIDGVLVDTGSVGLTLLFSSARSPEGVVYADPPAERQSASLLMMPGIPSPFYV